MLPPDFEPPQPQEPSDNERCPRCGRTHLSALDPRRGWPEAGGWALILMGAGVVAASFGGCF